MSPIFAIVWMSYLFTNGCKDLNATIAAGSVLSSGSLIKNACLVMGNPARVIRKNYDNSMLLRWQANIYKAGLN